MLLRHQKEGHSDTCQTRTDLEDIAPSEVKQPQTNKYWTVPLSEVPAVLEFTETEGGRFGEGDGEFVFRGDGVTVRKMERVLSGNGWQQWLHDNVKVLGATESDTPKGSKWSCLCYVYFTTTEK